MSRAEAVQALVDVEAERAVIGSMLLWQQAHAAVSPILLPDHFRAPIHKAIVEAIYHLGEHGHEVKPMSVAVEMIARGWDATAESLATVLTRMQLDDEAGARPTRLCERLLDLANRREIIFRLDEMLRSASDVSVDDPVGAADEVWRRAQFARSGPPADAMTIEQFLARPADPFHGWVVPGMIRHRDRVLIVATEGFGKATLMRQIGMCISQGLHPFRHTWHEPKRVLYVDGETGDGAVEEQIHLVRRGLLPKLPRDDAGNRMFVDGNYMMLNRETGLSLRDPVGREEVRALCASFKPDLLLLGPAYVLWPKGSREEWADPLVDAHRFTSELRKTFGCAVIIEAHAPQGTTQARDLRPEGSNYWRKWPDQGIAMALTSEPGVHPRTARIDTWRGARQRVEWPIDIEEGTQIGHLPWRGRYAGPASF